MRTAWLRVFAFLLLLVLSVAIASWLEPLPVYRAAASPASATDFDAFFAQRMAASEREGVSAGNDERLIRKTERTRLALLYIHGFGASRADGEYVVERLADALSANAYLMRLPGHGTTMEELDQYEFDAYVRAAEEALHMLGQLGEQRVVIGTSLGGALSTYLAAMHPDEVSALLLFSPFYEFVGIGQVLDLPGGVQLGEMLIGRERITEQPAEIASRIHPDYGKHWYLREYTSSLRVVRDIKRLVGRREVLGRVSCPVLLCFDPIDDVANVRAMHDAFASFRAHPRSREVSVGYGNHILASAYVATDKELILREARAFLEAL